MPTIDRDGVNLYYEVHGRGEPLILTHGYYSTSAMWKEQIDALSRRHKLILWDMRGHGDRRRAVARRLHVAGVLPGASRTRRCAPDHRYRTGLQERRCARDLEQ